MAQQILENGESKGVIRGKINDNFTELYDAAETNGNYIFSLQVAAETNNTNISALQEEATAKWVLLNTVDNRSRANETAIAELREILSRNGIV